PVTHGYDTPLIPNFDPPRRKTTPSAGSAQPRWREAGPPGNSMSADGRCACLEEGALRCHQIECNGGLEPQSFKNARQRQRWGLGQHNCAGEMDQRADRAKLVREVVMTGRTGRRLGFVTGERACKR